NRRGDGSRRSADWRADPDRQAVPREVLVPVLPPDAEAVQDWLAARRGGRVTLRVPQRGGEKTLIETVTRHPTEGLATHKTPTSPPAARRWRRYRTRSTWTPRRCGSSASTCRTCRAPTSSPRWWCSRTA